MPVIAMNRVKILREERNMTQTGLAEQSGLSLRTVQRIEAGSPLKGFTLKAIAKALEILPENLVLKTEEQMAVNRAKLINFSALAGLVLPFGGIIFPLLLTYKTKDPKNREMGKSIASIQILLTAVLSVLMILSPFLQKGLSIAFPVFLIPLLLFLCAKVAVVILNGISLNKKHDLHSKLKINFL